MVITSPQNNATAQAGTESPSVSAAITLKEAPHIAACTPNQPVLVMLINKAEIHRAP
jgi:hypothetical protein